ncbi:hypothetical protein QNO09_30325 [Streptomyces sp. 378]|uniref:hypothetical protein n=1 Tax=Streptomyces sp. 378 TaxID=3049412 RepID=UPI0024C3AC34|nr:hypothetical protein [Streptomyces sp. 378]MDK1347522.1 hypothetical protein [Streptomyces sp. 378]
MHDLIAPALHWLRLLFAPGTGKRRRGRRHLALVGCPSAPRPPQLPRHRSPYGLHGPLDGTACVLVRPYLAADLGIDFDQHLTGARKVAA